MTAKMFLIVASALGSLASAAYVLHHHAGGLHTILRSLGH
jgi:hypothetical protein